jgi:hypothetical protein
MTSDLTNKPALFIKVHALEIGLITHEDLAGLWDNPDLKRY